MRYGTTRYVLNDYKILQIICALLQNKSLFNQPVKYWTFIVHFFFRFTIWICAVRELSRLELQSRHIIAPNHINMIALRRRPRRIYEQNVFTTEWKYRRRFEYIIRIVYQGIIWVGNNGNNKYLIYTILSLRLYHCLYLYNTSK